MRRLIYVVLLLVSSINISACDSLQSVTNPSAVSSDKTGNQLTDAKDAAKSLFGPNQSIPAILSGPDLRSIHGWLANIYPWDYNPETSTVHPVPLLWTPHQKPSFSQMSEQCRQIKEYGGGAVVLEYSPNPNLDWHNYWLSNNFASACGPFFLLYEHINGTRFIPPDGGPVDMNNSYNRQVFRDDIDFMVSNVILHYQSRYVTLNGRAVIYMWLSSQMVGDFASLIEEVKQKYPVAFIGSEGLFNSTKPEDLARRKALDGFMEYSMGPFASSFQRMGNDYWNQSKNWAAKLRNWESETGKKYLFIPTFMAAYDDHKVPGRSNPSLYPISREQLELYAEKIRSGFGDPFDRIGPFVVQGETYEGSAVIESQCLPETINTPGRYVGCGTARLEILKKFFSW